MTACRPMSIETEPPPPRDVEPLPSSVNCRYWPRGVLFAEAPAAATSAHASTATTAATLSFPLTLAPRMPSPRRTGGIEMARDRGCNRPFGLFALLESGEELLDLERRERLDPGGAA